MKKRKAAAPMEGFEGRVTFQTRVRITSARSEVRSFRCRPGSFEWRYGRENANAALYHAGIALASLWERAEIGSAASPDLRRSHGGGWKGLPDSRTEALDQIKEARKTLNKRDPWMMARLVDYCVMGSTPREIAVKESQAGRHADARRMAAILEADLKAVADHFRLL